MMLEDFGKMVEPMPKNAPCYNLRAIIKYCDEKNISTEDLTKKELKQFELPPEKVPVNL
ncbi:MAG: hypothetical protein KGV57_04060 [Fusobacterium sp.]|nr:hypothetical protein [Fusobacterium sp.]